MTSATYEAGMVDAPVKRNPLALLVLLFAALLLFIGLGTWQVYRLQWKRALIERVDSRVHATAVPAPARSEWAGVNAAADEYRHVSVSGVFLDDQAVRVQAATALGAGFWVLTPLRQADGSIVLVNRGFVEAEQQVPPGSPHGQSVKLDGLLRMTEPGGGFLRHNDPAAGRWYSRDVQAIAQQQKLADVAPYFVDADAVQNADKSAPVGGLTVIAFHNNHLVYAFTWYALALMSAFAAFSLLRAKARDA
ncbi:MAG TPA: SURF1 family protein [Burkholderiaceae bacterium]